MSLPENPETRREQYLSVIAGQNTTDILPETPYTREEQYLDYIARNGGGGGSSVQADWDEADDTKPDYIKNKPTIPDVSGKQDKTMSSPVTIGGETETTVEGTIGVIADVIPSTAASGNKLVTAADINPWNTPEMHRMIFRGKNLGSSVSAEQLAAIRDGSFRDLFVGDYWETTVTISATIDGTEVSSTFLEKWRIADINYWLGCGDTAFTSPHLVIVPDKILYTAKMNDTNITTGGYVKSKMRDTTSDVAYSGNLQYALTAINAAFPDMVLAHKEYLVHGVTNGKASGAVWTDSTIDLMNENMIFGHREFTPGSSGTDYPINCTIDKTILALFQIAPKFINCGEIYWLRDIMSTYFVVMDATGTADANSPSRSRGVRPVFAIG